MVVPLGPGKFYGTSLPRPRIYTDIKFNDERVDPPVSVSDPLLSWASEAHWSMGGLSFKRLRLQGRIEGSISKLRGSRKARDINSVSAADPSPAIRDSPPPAPMAVKRRRFLAMIEEDEEEEEDVEERKGRARRRRLVKKLDDDFDRVASETARDEDDDVAVAGVVNKVQSKGKKSAEIVNKVKARGRKSKSGEESAVAKPRTSPRFKSV